ncbi:MAG: CU044_5270 family protein [Streptomyces sp.]|nr:CU044_5270 family protein [Streptomyces sp.]NUP39964.1 CU044_5270 family protein [Streptomyces sp.]
MREFQVIDEVMPDVPPASPAQLAAARARVFGAARETNPATVERVRPAGGVRRGGHAGHGLVAVLAAAAVVLVITIMMVAVPRPGEEPAVSPAQEVLGVAADRLAAQPPATGAYWRLETQEIILTKDSAKGYPVQERGNNVLVIGRDGHRYTWYEAVSTAPYGPAAERAWKKAGSPKLCPARGCDPNGRFYARHPLDRALKLADGLTLTLSELLTLPQEATALRARLLEGYPAGSELSREQWLVGAGVKLVAQTPATPGTRAAGYRMLAALPGAGVIDGAGDVLGRQGVIVQFPPATPGVVRTQLVIDRQSGEPLAIQQVAPFSGLSEDTVWMATVIKRPYWTDIRPVVPSGCRNGCTS